MRELGVEYVLCIYTDLTTKIKRPLDCAVKQLSDQAVEQLRRYAVTETNTSAMLPITLRRPARLAQS